MDVRGRPGRVFLVGQSFRNHPIRHVSGNLGKSTVVPRSAEQIPCPIDEEGIDLGEGGGDLSAAPRLGRGGSKARGCKATVVPAEPPTPPEPGGRASPTPDLTEVLAAHRRRTSQALNYADQMLVAAASACADVLALRIPQASRPGAHRAYERQLRREFQASFERFKNLWLDQDNG